jgi:predicted RNA-binding protein
MKYYIISVRKDNFNIIKDMGFNLIGFSQKEKRLKDFKKGDILILYIGSRISCFGAILEVISDNIIYDNTLIWDDIFPNRIITKPIIILDKNNYVYVSNIKDKLSFIKREDISFGMYFQRTIREINQNDYEVINNHMKLHCRFVV